MRIPAWSLVAGALAFASVASAQVDSVRRSTTRIPISKGEPARVDTVTVYRTDTVTREITKRVHDTVRVRRVDTVHTAAGVIPTRIREIGGFYAGVGFGAAVPAGNDFTTFQSTGWHVMVPVGWDPIGMPVGGRVTFGFSQFGKQGVFDQAFTNPEIFHTDLDLKLRYPIESEWMRRFSVYGVGGVTYNAFRSIAQFDRETGLVTIGDSSGRVTTINVGFPSAIDNSWHSAWGWNVGGGIQMGWKRSNVFVESRYSHFDHDDFTIAQVPILIGASWWF